MVDTLSTGISPNSVTQRKDSEPFQGRGLCHTDGKGLKQMVQERTWKQMTARNGMGLETQGQAGCELGRKADTESL